MRVPRRWRTPCTRRSLWRHFWRRICLEQVLIALTAVCRDKYSRVKFFWESIILPIQNGRTCRICSMPSPRFVLRIRCASSSVIRCSRVSLSVTEPVVAFPTPATSEPIAPCGRCFASTRTHKRVVQPQPYHYEDTLFAACRPASSSAFPNIWVPVIRIWIIIFGADWRRECHMSLCQEM